MEIFSLSIEPVQSASDFKKSGGSATRPFSFVQLMFPSIICRVQKAIPRNLWLFYGRMDSKRINKSDGKGWGVCPTTGQQSGRKNHDKGAAPLNVDKCQYG